MSNNLKKTRRRPEPDTVNGGHQTDRLPPHSVEMEQGVLGCILLAPGDSMGLCVEKLKGHGKAVFYDLRHQAIYHAMAEMHDAGEAVDIITLQQRLKESGDRLKPGHHTLLDQVGGIPYLSKLQDKVPSAANLSYYLDAVREKYLRRRMITVCTEIMGRAFDDGGSATGLTAEQLADEFERDASRLTEFAAGEPEEKHIKEVITAVFADMEQWHYARGSQQLRGLPTGPPGVYLDKILMGIRDTHYVVIAGRPGDGKSSIAMNIVEYLATEYEWYEGTGEKVDNDGVMVEKVVKRKGIPVAVFTLEMDNESLGYRLLFGRAGVDEAQFNQGFAHKDDPKRLVTAMDQLIKANIYLDDTPSQSIGRIAAKARRMAAQYGIKLFVLDYLQLPVSDNPRDDERTRLDKISKKIMALKKQLKVPWLVLGQMNRNIETAERDRAPMLSDLQGCGSIEQDSDKVLILKRPTRRELEKPGAPIATENGIVEGPSDQEILDRVCGDWEWSRRPTRVDAWVVKNRRGPRGKAEMVFQNNLCRFEDYHMWKVKHGVEGRKAGESKAALPTNEELGLTAKSTESTKGEQ